jgi:hypothetical protein
MAQSLLSGRCLWADQPCSFYTVRKESQFAAVAVIVDADVYIIEKSAATTFC